MSTEYTIPNRPSGTDTKSIEGIVDDFDAILDALNSYDGANVQEKTMAPSSIVVPQAKIIIGDSTGKGIARSVAGILTVDEFGVFDITDDFLTLDHIPDDLITDDKLAAPNNDVYSSLFQATGFLVNDAGPDTYMLTMSRAAQTPYSLDTTNLTARIVPLFRWQAADFDVPTLGTQMLIRSEVATNATAPGGNYTFGLYPLTVDGGADVLRFTLGVVVPGSTCQHAAPAASNVSTVSSGDFDPPANGIYCLGCVSSAGVNNNAAVQLSAQVYCHNV
jgi:hypothetical protein